MLLVSTGPASSSLGPVHASVPPQEEGGAITAVLSSKRHSTHVTADHHMLRVHISLFFLIYLKFHIYIFFQLGSYLNLESLLWEKDR